MNVVEPRLRLGKVIDHTRCIGCHACTTACRSENEVPLSVTRTYVKYVDVGVFPDTRRAFQVNRCNQCDDAPCVAACPTSAMHRRADGIVDFDKAACIGCKACMAACPYDAIFINPDDHTAEKCNLCAHRLDVGLEPACVVVCPTGAILVGDLDDPASPVAAIVAAGDTAVRRPDKGTLPKLYYRGAAPETLDPLAARRPDGGLYLWSEQGDVPHGVPAGAPASHAAAPDAVLAYDVPHRAPWDWRVGLYTWTKSIAAGAYLVPALLLALGAIGRGSALWRTAAPLLALAGLLVTGGVLVADLERPARFWYLLTRPQWRSWLVRGAVILALTGAVLAVHLAATVAGARALQPWLAVAGVPLAVATAIYTGFLLAQARGRDLWASRLLAPHLLVQAGLAGAAALAPLVRAVDVDGVRGVRVVLLVSLAAHVALALAEGLHRQPTGHARLAAHVLVRGRLAWWFWGGLGACVVAAALVPLSLAAAGVLALAGLLAHEHAYIAAGQEVPLA